MSIFSECSLRGLASPSGAQGDFVVVVVFYLGSSLSSPRSTRPQPPGDDDGEKLVNRFGVEKK